jgi:FkbM family methyltransferase
LFTIRTRHKIALAKMAYRLVSFGRRILGKSDRVIVKRSNLVWELNLAEGIDFSIYLLGAFEPQTIKLYGRLIRAGDVVADIGANIGAHSLPLAMLVGDTGRVLCFEPTDYAFQKLTRNIALNRELASRLETRQAMLVATDQDVVEPELYSSWPLKGAGALHEQHRGRLMEASGADALTFDAAMMLSGATELNFVKLDVDGHEFKVLMGARKTLEKFKPKLLMELDPCLYVSKSHEFDNMIKILNELGGRMTDVNTGIPLPLDADALRKIIPDGASRNVLVSF